MFTSRTFQSENLETILNQSSFHFEIYILNVMMLDFQ